MTEHRSDDGRFTPEHTDAEILAAVRSHEPAATSEVAGEVGMTRQGADRRLRRLRDGGRVNSKKIGASLVWFAPDPTGGESEREPATDAVEDEADRGDTSPTTARTRDRALTDVVDRVAERWDDADERFEARKAAARAVLEYAREHGGVSKQEAKEDVYPEYPVEGQNERTWYRKSIRPVLNEAAEYDQSERAYRLELEDE